MKAPASVSVGAVLRAYRDKQITLTPHEYSAFCRMPKSMRVHGLILPPAIKHPKCDWCGKPGTTNPKTKKTRCTAHTF
jgi:hypothetical protein